MNDSSFWLTLTIFVLTYAGLAAGKVPGLRMDRAGIALVGATLMLVTGVLTFDQAASPQSIDYKTLAVLFGMMIVVGALRLSGFFKRATALAARRIAAPRSLLAVTIVLAGLLSAFLINDVVCIAIAPLVLHLARRMNFDPVPHLIALATAANVGSTGTITGNPQNIYIGAHSGISYLRFAARLMPIALLGMGLTFALICWIYRRQLAPAGDRARAHPRNPTAKAAAIDVARRGSHRRLQRKSIGVAVLAVVLFFVGLPLELVALGAAAIVLLDRIKPEKISRQVDWGLLVMFSGLFIVVHAFQVHVVSGWGISSWSWLSNHPIGVLTLVSAGLSNLVSNVPAVLLLEPVVQTIPAASRETAWLALAMSSTLAGNLTLLGSVANLIVAESASRHGVQISFVEYCKVGVPLTLATLLLGFAWLRYVPY